MTYALGIDLGTTYSAAAVAEDGRVEIVQLGDRAATIPSVVVLRADGEVLTGDAAERRSMAEPTRTAREAKRRLGDPTPIILGGTPYGADALLAHLLRAIVGQIVGQRDERPSAIVLTHPASYGPYKLDLLRQAVRQADIGDVEFMTEPEAAALHYASQARVPVGAVIAIYDFGGGTFDATILRKTSSGFEQLGTPEGIERLGGIDFDEAVMAHVDTSLGGALARLDPGDPRARAAMTRLREEARRAKEALSLDTDATIATLLPGGQDEVRLTRPEFEQVIRPRIRETISALQRAIRSAHLTPSDIDRILLVGGTSRIPLIAEMVREATERPVAVDAHPKHTVALGAARRAGRLDQSTAEPVAAPPLVPVVPMPVVATDVAAPPVVATDVAAPPVVQTPVVQTPMPVPAAAAAAPIAGTEALVREPAAPPPAPPAAVARAAASAMTASAEPRAARVPSGEPSDARRRSRRPLAFGLVAALVAAGALGVAAMAINGGLGGGATATPSPTLAAVLPSPTLAATTPSPSIAPSPSPSPSAALVIASISPAPTPSPTPSPTPVVTVRPTVVVTPPPTPKPTAAPTPAPATPVATTRPPRTASIERIRVVNGRYSVDFTTDGFTPVLPGRHVHFFFDTVSVSQAGVPGSGPWFLYGGPSPFTGYSVSQRPAGADQLCILVANSDHSIVRGTGNCVDLP